MDSRSRVHGYPDMHQPEANTERLLLEVKSMVALNKIAGRSFKKGLNYEIETPGKDRPTKPHEGETSNPLSEDEQHLLFKLAEKISRGQACVCVGSEEAVTWLVRGLKKEQRVKIYFINSFESDKAADSSDEEIGTGSFTDLSPEELEGMNICRYRTSSEASRRCKEKVGLLWINASYTYEDLKRILLAWQSKLAANAKIAFHGCHLPAPARLIKEYLGDQGDFQLSDSVSLTSVMRLDQCTHYWIIDSRDVGACKYCGRKRNFKRIRNGAQHINILKKNKKF